MNKKKYIILIFYIYINILKAGKAEIPSIQSIPIISVIVKEVTLKSLQENITSGKNAKVFNDLVRSYSSECTRQKYNLFTLLGNLHSAVLLKPAVKKKLELIKEYPGIMMVYIDWGIRTDRLIKTGHIVIEERMLISADEKGLKRLEDKLKNDNLTPPQVAISKLKFIEIFRSAAHKTFTKCNFKGSLDISKEAKQELLDFEKKIQVDVTMQKELDQYKKVMSKNQDLLLENQKLQLLELLRINSEKIIQAKNDESNDFIEYSKKKILIMKKVNHNYRIYENYKNYYSRIDELEKLFEIEAEQEKKDLIAFELYRLTIARNKYLLTQGYEESREFELDKDTEIEMSKVKLSIKYQDHISEKKEKELDQNNTKAMILSKEDEDMENRRLDKIRKLIDFSSRPELSEEDDDPLDEKTKADMEIVISSDLYKNFIDQKILLSISKDVRKIKKLLYDFDRTESLSISQQVINDHYKNKK